MTADSAWVSICRPELAPAEAWAPSLGSLDVWWIDLGGGPADRAANCLTKEERERAQRLVVPAKRRQFELTRAALRRILGRVLELDPSEVLLIEGEHGKLAVRHGIFFNVTHSAELALIAVQSSGFAFEATPLRLETGGLGIDVEQVDPERPLTRMAQRFFHADEAHAFLKLDTQVRTVDFYRRWALKEAYVKALGTGLTYSSRKFQLDDDLPTCAWRGLVASCARHPDQTERWRFANGWLGHRGNEYAVAVCSSREPEQVRFFEAPARQQGSRSNR